VAQEAQEHLVSEERIVTTPVDPYLPVPRDNPPEQKSASPRKTLLIWVVLVVMFVALYQVFKGPDGAHHRAPATEVCGNDGVGSYLWSWLPIIFLVLIVVWLFRQLRQVKGFNEATNAALLAVADGDMERGRQLFAELLQRSKGTTSAYNAQINLAWCLQRLGRYDEERDVLLALERSPGLFHASEHRLYAAVYLLRHFARRGDVARAEVWLADARLRRDKLSDVAPFLVGQLRVAEAILLTRRERDAEALAILERDWPRLEASFTSALLKHVILLRAYLLARTGGVRGEGISAQWLTKLRPVRLDEIGYLWAEWPSLRTFVEAHQLVEPAAQTA
jgi:hypothetical protein